MRAASLFLAFLICCSSCGIVTGVQRARSLSDRKIMHCARKYNIDRFNIYKLDTAYSVYLGSLQNARHDSDAAYNLAQPLQYMLFDKNGTLLSYNVNEAMEKKHMSIDWNTDGCFNLFPPKSLAASSANINYSSLRPFFIPVSMVNEDKNTLYTCVIFWNHFMSKGTGGLIKTALHNLQEYTSDRTVALVFVNDDGYFAK